MIERAKPMLAKSTMGTSGQSGYRTSNTVSASHLLRFWVGAGLW